LLGVVATSKDTENLQNNCLRDLVINVSRLTEEALFDVASIRPVPPDKLDFNKLPGHWRALIANGWQNTHLVSGYLERHHDPLIGERIAQVLRVRYQYLKAQNLLPGAIMTELYELIAGVGSVTPQRQVAAQALLAFFFESCDIFEDKPTPASS
jgi:hypothetical protein